VASKKTSKKGREGKVGVDHPPLMSSAEAASELGIPAETLNRLVELGREPSAEDEVKAYFA